MTFKAMNKKVLQEVLERPQICARRDERTCDGRITIEHVFGRKKEAEWNCILLCEKHHSVGAWQNDGLLNKQMNRFFAYQQATDAMIMRTYPKTHKSVLQDKKWLELIYKNLL